LSDDYRTHDVTVLNVICRKDTKNLGIIIRFDEKLYLIYILSENQWSGESDGWNQGVGESDHSPTFIFSVEKIIRLFC